MIKTCQYFVKIVTGICYSQRFDVLKKIFKKKKTREKEITLQTTFNLSSIDLANI